jgi:hypothetical protein
MCSLWFRQFWQHFPATCSRVFPVVFFWPPVTVIHQVLTVIRYAPEPEQALQPGRRSMI